MPAKIFSSRSVGCPAAGTGGLGIPRFSRQTVRESLSQLHQRRPDRARSRLTLTAWTRARYLISSSSYTDSTRCLVRTGHQGGDEMTERNLAALNRFARA